MSEQICTDAEIIKREIEAFAAYLPSIADLPSIDFDKEFHEKLNCINDLSLSFPEHRQDMMNSFFAAAAAELFPGAMQTHSRLKPLGYPGDHLIIDWIYTKKTTRDSKGRLWDEFYHRQAAPQAVRNRKAFFIETFLKLCHEHSGKLSLLNIASGPCRDIAEALEQMGGDAKDISIYCVDMDKDAIAYAKGLLNGSFSKAIFHWEAANAFKIRLAKKFDLTWSAGLFDYLEDRFAIALIKRMWGWTKEGGTMIFGNFHPRNPSRTYMEWCGAWFLIHRTEKDMIELCRQAGIQEACIKIEQEPLGVNLFCIVKKE